MRQRYAQRQWIDASMSLQEMLEIWVPLNFVQIQYFDLELESDIHPFQYKFISHKHSTDPDILGPGFRNSSATLGEEII
jgi:hypothetical protein